MPHRFSPSRPLLFVALLMASASHVHPQSLPRDATAQPILTAPIAATITEASRDSTYPKLGSALSYVRKAMATPQSCRQPARSDSCR